MSKLRELSRELGAEIIYFLPSSDGVTLIEDVKGLYLPEHNIIYIRDDLSIVEQENVILHELGHCYYGHCHYGCHSVMYGSKQEAEADYYMVLYRFNEWLSAWDFAPEPYEISLSQFMNAYEFNQRFRFLCEKVIEEYTAEYCEAI